LRRQHEDLFFAGKIENRENPDGKKHRELAQESGGGLRRNRHLK
jgi:hypothetical protein